jgi:hypothetical protein
MGRTDDGDPTKLPQTARGAGYRGEAAPQKVGRFESRRVSLAGMRKHDLHLDRRQSWCLNTDPVALFEISFLHLPRNSL